MRIPGLDSASRPFPPLLAGIRWLLLARPCPGGCRRALVGPSIPLQNGSPPMSPLKRDEESGGDPQGLKTQSLGFARVAGNSVGNDPVSLPFIHKYYACELWVLKNLLCQVSPTLMRCLRCSLLVLSTKHSCLMRLTSLSRDILVVQIYKQPQLS